MIFTLGLGIFLYPIVSNMFATTAHQSTIKNYKKTVQKMDPASINNEKKKIEKHNKKLTESELNFVDPFAESDSKEDVGTKSYYDALNIGPSIGNVEIPKIDVELPIYHGTSEKVLSKGAGHLENSSLPTSKPGTHSVITAHRGLPSAKLFRDLDKLEIGDQFYIEILDETLAYEVDRIDIVLPHETEWLTMEENENVTTLLTCDPYMINTHRMLVTGHQVPYNPDEKPEKTKVYTDYYLFAVMIVALLLLIYYLRRRKKKIGDNDEKE